MRVFLLLALVTACAHAPAPALRCDLASLPKWQSVTTGAGPDGGVCFAPAEAAKLAQDVNALRDWSRQAAACLNVPEAPEAPDGG